MKTNNYKCQPLTLSKLKFDRVKRGQSLTEILVALAIGVAFINVGILAMSTANILAKVNKANNFALTLLKSQRRTIETITENGWHSIDDLTIGKHYKLAKQNNSWVVQPGEEKVFDEKPPVAQWNFDEGSGTTAYDNVGTNNGALVSSPTWQASSNCVNGGCLSFNGANYVTVANALNQVNLEQEWSVDAWVNISNTGSTQSLISGINSGLNLTQGTTDKLLLYVNWGTNDYYVYSDQAGLLTGKGWKHVVFVFRNSDGYRRIYVDGVNHTGSGPNLTNTPLGIASTWNIGQSTNGIIDDVRIYDYALTESQIKQHYNAGLNRLGLVSQWGMDEGSGITTYNLQGSHDGTLVSGPTWKSKQNCVSGECLSFDGVDDTLSIGVGSDYFPLPLFSICTWVKSSGLASGMVQNGIFECANVMSMYLANDGRFFAYIFDGANNQSVIADGNFYDNKFHDVCFTYDGANLQSFVDGVRKDGRQVTWPGTTSWPTLSCDIGRASVGGVSRFNGFIDDVRIYNRALSADEIANQYKDGYTKYFYVNNVSRDTASDPTASTHNLETIYDSTHDDPNTKKVVNVTRYLLGTPGRVNTQEQYLARAANINSLVQTDWSGSSGVTGPEIDFGSNYSSASNLTLSATGQMSLTSAASNGTLTSTIIDTQSIGGSGYFNILWQGDALCAGCSVRFQIAASNSNAGPWTYYGPTSGSDYYTPSGPGVSVPITYAGQYSALSSSVQNKRYIRYQITLVPASSVSPVVKDVIINYSP